MKLITTIIVLLLTSTTFAEEMIYFQCDSMDAGLNEESTHHISVSPIETNEEGKKTRAVLLNIKDKKNHCLMPRTKQRFTVDIDEQKQFTDDQFNFVSNIRTIKEGEHSIVASIEMYEGETMVLIYTPPSCLNEGIQQGSCSSIKIDMFACMQIYKGTQLPICKDKAL